MNTPQLSVNINKYALLRNSRGRDLPDLQWAIDEVLAAGAHGITIHPRRDQRHIRLDDVPKIAAHLQLHHPQVELNIECEDHPDLVALVCEIKPAQCTLVPVRPGEITSDHGYDFPSDIPKLAPLIQQLISAGVRISAFVDCEPNLIREARDSGIDRVELYTGPYAWAWGTPHQAQQIAQIWKAAQAAQEVGIGLNAGHDLDRFNLVGLRGLPGLLEVSIGHAQICRALEVGTRQSVQELLAALHA